MLVDSKKKQLKDEAVLMVAAQETKSKYPAATVFAALVEEMNQYGTSTYRAGNTIFVMHHAKDRIGFFRALNADTARNYLENSYEWVQAAYKMGFDVMQTEFEDPTHQCVQGHLAQSAARGHGLQSREVDQRLSRHFETWPKA